jgi:DNA-3-methyladenine glycosylase I
MESIQIRPKTAADAEWAEGFLKKQANGTYLPELANGTSSSTLHGWVAEIKDEPVGLLMYHFQNNTCNIISFYVSRKRMGIGEGLLTRLETEARDKVCERLICVVGNDNLNALRFLQKRAFHLTELRVGAVEARRKQNPSIQLTGEYGIPLRDELVLEKNLRLA